MAGGIMAPAAGMAAVAAAIVMLWAGWSRAGRGGRPHALCGLLAAVAGLGLLGVGDGAWGVAVGLIAAMLTAFLVLARAAWTSPPSRERPARDLRPRAVPRAGGAVGVARRVAVFLMTVPGACAAGSLAALALQALARAGGWPEADSTTLGLLAFPVAWAALAVWLLLQARPAAMLAPLLGTGIVAGATLWLAV